MPKLLAHVKWLCLLALLSLLPACRRTRSSIPDVPVRIERSLSVINCLFPGSSWRLTSRQLAADQTGFGGVMLVCAFDGTYHAFDLSCPVEASATVRVGKPDDMLRVECPSCGELYDCSFGLGTPTRGIADEPLKRYAVSLSGGTVYIHN
ncbi:MAG: hypothetical protein IJ154_02755 [Bacteroidales bacterium]|nr:hypothetical protein [Bacteroidales bacterium]